MLPEVKSAEEQGLFLSFRLFEREINAPVTHTQLVTLENILIRHKAGFGIALSLGLVTTAVTIYKRERQKAQNKKNGQANQLIKDTVPLTDEESKRFEAFFERTSMNALLYVTSMGITTHDREEAKDIIANVYLNFLEKWTVYRSKTDEELRAMFFTSLRNREYNWLRDISRHPHQSLDATIENDALASTGDEVSQRFDELREHWVNEALLAKLSLLPQKQKLATVLWLAGLEPRDFAAVLETTQGGAKLMWARARQALREQIAVASVKADRLR